MTPCGASQGGYGARFNVKDDIEVDADFIELPRRWILANGVDAAELLVSDMRVPRTPVRQ